MTGRREGGPRAALSRLRRALSEPEQASRFLERRIAELVALARVPRPGAIAAYLFAGATGLRPYDRYLRYLAWRCGGTIAREIAGSEMVLDLADAGLSRELWLYGVREETTVERFEEELSILRSEVDGPVGVIEIGANLGYFALAEARSLGERAEIVAFEPDPRNRSLLRETLARNGLGDVTVEPYALGASDADATLSASTHSNRNRIEPRREHRGPLSLTGETREVAMRSVDSYLRSTGRSPDSVHVVRMDVEGYETEILQGMRSLFEAEGPLLLFVEVHPGLLSEVEFERFVSTLCDHGFELRCAISEGISARPFDGTLDVPDLRSIPSVGRSGFKLFVKRSGE
ncbi:FkbM family methyltransferase [Natronorarus salvus]|uniref:FkbM family methyltransferase n=1 Tax=Natronorarus salvus TaxID=3117733 RepID=UPI002F25F788